MLVEKNLLALLYMGTRHRHAYDKRMARAHDIALVNAKRQLAPQGRQRTARGTKNLIATLLSFGNRAARSTKPYTQISMNVISPNGRKAVRIKMRRG